MKSVFLLWGCMAEPDEKKRRGDAGEPSGGRFSLPQEAEQVYERDDPCFDSQLQVREAV
jgi:hypothetical protein